MNIPPQSNFQRKDENVNLLDAQKSQQFLAQLNLIHQLQN